MLQHMLTSPSARQAFMMSHYDLPASFSNPETAAQAWSAVFGSKAAAEAYARKLLDKRYHWTSFSRKDMKVMPFFAVLSGLFGMEQRLNAIGLSDEEKSAVCIIEKFSQLSERILGRELMIGIAATVFNQSVEDLSQTILSAFPELELLFQVGLFERSSCLHLLVVDSLLRIHQAPETKQSIRYQAEMSMYMYIQGLTPGTLPGVLVSSRPLFHELFPSIPQLVNGSVVEGDDLAVSLPGTRVWAYISSAIEEIEERRVEESGSLAILSKAEALALAGAQLPKFVATAIRKAAEDLLVEDWRYHVSEIKKAAALIGLTGEAEVLDEEAFCVDLRVIRDVSAPEVSGIFIQVRRFVEGVSRLRREEHFHSVQEDVERIRLAMEKAAKDVSPEGMARLVEMAASSKDTLKRHEDGIRERITRSNEIQEVWREFIQSCEVMVQVQAVEVDRTSPDSGERNEAEELLGLYRANEAQNQAEIKSLRLALHNLRMRHAAVPSLADGFEKLEADVEVLRRIATRNKSVTPADVMAYIEYVAGDRVTVLPSCWRSLKGTELFQDVWRMLELLDTAVFAYLDMLRSGRPDSEAKDLLGNGYSARESDTVKADKRLRSQREFMFQGELRLFERHLRIGNGTGAQTGMRIYFDVIDNRLVIAYAGPHLEVASSN